MRFVYFAAPMLLFALILVWTRQTSAVPFLRRVLTIDQFSTRPYLRDRVLMYCASHPDLLDGDPNCANAQQSAGNSLPDSDGMPLVDTTSVAADGILWRGTAR